jgi:hypothetical protein
MACEGSVLAAKSLCEIGNPSEYVLGRNGRVKSQSALKAWAGPAVRHTSDARPLACGVAERHMPGRSDISTRRNLRRGTRCIAAIQPGEFPGGGGNDNRSNYVAGNKAHSGFYKYETRLFHQVLGRFSTLQAPKSSLGIPTPGALGNQFRVLVPESFRDMAIPANGRMGREILRELFRRHRVPVHSFLL